MNSLSWGILSTGRIAGIFARQLSESKTGRLAAVGSRSQANADKFAAAGASIIGVLTPLAGGPLFLATLMVFLPQLLGDGLQTIEEVAELSLIQGMVPNEILGRVNATLEVFSHGIAYPIGALSAAAVASLIGVRGGIAIGWAGMALSILLLLLSPLPRIRRPSDVDSLEP